MGNFFKKTIQADFGTFTHIATNSGIFRNSSDILRTLCDKTRPIQNLKYSEPEVFFLIGIHSLQG